MQFRNLLKASLSSVAVAALVAAPISTTLAQTRPTSTPTYIPNGIFAPQTVAAASAPVATTPYVTANESTILARVGGTFTGLTGIFQVSSDSPSTAAASSTWVNVNAVPMSGVGGIVKTVIAAGTYRINTNGATKVRFNITAMSTGSVVLQTTGSLGAALPDVGFAKRGTYMASFQITPAASGTDLFTLNGAANVNTRINDLRCDGTATAIGAGYLFGLTRSTADTGGTSTAPTAVPIDPNDPAATATLALYSANPTVGALVGNVWEGTLVYTPVATTTIGTSPIEMKFGSAVDASTEGLTLRTAAQGFALNSGGVSQPSGAKVNCSIVWSEEQ